jgi:23S rRNA (uracil1939-C5)-methyltransferase
MENSLIEKNKEYIVNIIDNGYDGEGIAKIDNFTIFVPTAIKGEKCKILIVKVCPTYAYGKIIEILEKSNVRKEEDCLTYKRCGGCSLRHIDYQYTLDMKRNMVQNLINKTLNNTIEVSNTIGMKKPYYYRNKLQYPIGKDKNQEPVMGVFAKRTHEIIPISKCIIQNEKAEEVAKYLFELIKQYHIPIYDEKKHTGTIRHIVIKIGIRTNEIMCIIVTNDESIPQENTIVEKIVDRFPEVKTIIKNINSKNTNVILGKKNIVLYGDGYIYDKLGNYIFKISPLSFYQTNPIQTELLYNKAIEFANLSKEDVLCDLYCGIGTIGIFASKFVKKVYGIEIVEEAIEDAKENAKLNNIDNIEFFAGDVEKVFEKILQEKRVTPTAIIVDPPRKGLDNTTIKTILKLNVSKLVYISCNPATMLRDLKMLEEKYFVKKIQPVDMFPFTSHVEVCALLELKNCQ